MIHFKPVEHHISERDGARLCDSEPASEHDILSENIFELRDARRNTTLCPDCQDKMHPLDMHLELYGMGRHTPAHLYAPALEGFYAVRICSHCRRSTDDDCKAWRDLRKSMAVLRQECRRYAKGVDELQEATGGRLAIIYEYHAGSVAYFAPDAPDFAEAGELKGDDVAVAQRIFDERGLPGGNIGDSQSLALSGACVVSIPAARGTGIPSAKIQVLYGDCAATDFIVSG
ncbi:MAG: hypothetical protein OXI16_13380 [Chloroflexota bacterium]|nr:hypothetical protein [Chloroflexota bacterium]